jgi:hypothetical protein
MTHLSLSALQSVYSPSWEEESSIAIERLIQARMQIMTHDLVSQLRNENTLLRTKRKAVPEHRLDCVQIQGLGLSKRDFEEKLREEQVIKPDPFS